MPVLSEGLNLGDLLKYEAPNLYSRDQVTVAAGQKLPLGAVVGREASTAHIKRIDPAASDGTQIAIGVLGNEVDAGLIERDDGILIARHAVVADHALNWPAGLTAQDKATAIDQLKAAGVLVRHAV